MDSPFIISKGSKPCDDVMSPQTLRGFVSDVDRIMEKNQSAKQIMEEKDSGRPGHYYGRDVVLEGAVPLAVHLMAAREFGDDISWFQDDRKFQDFMVRHPEYSYLRRR